MTDRPILFSAPMVRALLDGRKTQTRRVAKVRKGLTLAEMVEHGERRGVGPMTVHQATRDMLAEPRFAAGDRLWVKETWKPGSWREDGRVACDYRASPELIHTPWCRPDNFEDLWPKWTDELVANGSTPDAGGIHHWQPGKSPLKWRPSIFMPRWASRLTLTVTDVRVERLHAISEADAIAEGVAEYPCEGPHRGPDATYWTAYPASKLFIKRTTAVNAYAALWESINGPGAWEANPWVVAVSFEVGRHNIDQVPA